MLDMSDAESISDGDAADLLDVEEDADGDADADGVVDAVVLVHPGLDAITEQMDALEAWEQADPNALGVF